MAVNAQSQDFDTMMTFHSTIGYAYFDVDDTLIEWLEPTDSRIDPRANILPLVCEDVLFFPMRENIEKLKSAHACGKLVVVWSEGGAEWVEKIMNILNLTDHIDLAIGKPSEFCDDLHPSYWLRRNIF